MNLPAFFIYKSDNIWWEGELHCFRKIISVLLVHILLSALVETNLSCLDGQEEFGGITTNNNRWKELSAQ